MNEYALTKNESNIIDAMSIFGEIIGDDDFAKSQLGDDINGIALKNEYKNEIVQNIKKIMSSFTEDLIAYTNAYNVTPSNDVLDHMKLNYFCGIAITKQLNFVGRSDLGKLQLLAIQKLFDQLLSKIGAHRPPLTYRLQNAINTNRINDDLGRFGWYLLYKCLYKQAEEFKAK